MKRILCAILFVISCVASAQSVADTLSYDLEGVSVVEFYREDLNVVNVIKRDEIQKENKGQDPSFIFASRPSIFAYSDTGNEYGYSYFRVRGMDQTRVNMTLDGMPLNEGEDQGVYFSNYPDMLSSMHSFKVSNGASVTGNGVAGYAGTIDFESVDLLRDTLSSAYVGYGSWNTAKAGVEYNSGRIGKTALHFKLTHQHSDGYKRHAYNSSESAFVKVGYFINDHHSVDILSFVGLSRNGSGWIGSSVEELENDFRANGCSEEETDKFLQSITKLQYKGFLTDNLSLTASLYHNYLNGYYLFDLDNFMTRVVDPSWLPIGEVDSYGLRHNMTGGNVAAKLSLMNFSVTSGLNASVFNRRHIGTNNLQTEELWNNIGYKNDVNSFVKFDYKWREFTSGVNLQYRHADFSYDGDVPFERVNWDFFNWSAHLRWDFSRGQSLYLSATSTHREPTRTDMFGGEENLVDVVTTQAESVIDYEFGYNVLLDKLQANINLYYMDFANELILNGQVGTNGLPIRVNSAKSYRTGVELSLTYKPVEKLSLINNTSWSANKVRLEDEVLNHVMSPSLMVNQEVACDFGACDVGMDMKYRSGVFFDLPNQYKIEGAVKFGAYVQYTFGNVILGAHLNNIFDTHSFSYGMMGASGPLYFVDPARNFFIDMRVLF